eukprot:8829080-Prorocentrum_lima.AAC.1
MSTNIKIAKKELQEEMSNYRPRKGIQGSVLQRARALIGYVSLEEMEWNLIPDKFAVGTCSTHPL